MTPHASLIIAEYLFGNDAIITIPENGLKIVKRGLQDACTDLYVRMAENEKLRYMNWSKKRDERERELGKALASKSSPCKTQIDSANPIPQNSDGGH